MTLCPLFQLLSQELLCLSMSWKVHSPILFCKPLGTQQGFRNGYLIQRVTVALGLCGVALGRNLCYKLHKHLQSNSIGRGENFSFRVSAPTSLYLLTSGKFFEVKKKRFKIFAILGKNYTTHHLPSQYQIVLPLYFDISSPQVIIRCTSLLNYYRPLNIPLLMFHNGKSNIILEDLEKSAFVITLSFLLFSNAVVYVQIP